MTQDTVRLVQNLRQFLDRCTWEELYLIAECLAVELTARGQDAALEARALQCALLPLAHAARAAIYSEDCTTYPLMRAVSGCRVGPIQTPE